MREIINRTDKKIEVWCDDVRFILEPQERIDHLLFDKFKQISIYNYHKIG